LVLDKISKTMALARQHHWIGLEVLSRAKPPKRFCDYFIHFPF